ELLVPPAPRERSKKEAWLSDKTARHDVHVADHDLQRGPLRVRPAPVAAAPGRPGATVQPITTLYNMWTHEALPLLPGQAADDRFHPFLRDHFTNQATRMDVRLIDVLAQVARKFRAARIEVVSGYRSPKYNLMLRKKGHQVARASQHTEGHAVDFRVRGVPTPVLLKYVRSLHRGGVGFYPHSQFVHSDTGPIRFWKGS
ncbi:MAG TPA: DUF882 domain-containing protein, partial [Polyangia bacterium]|nr:DUF882 domain-containing protein [Polyangia bacterium]